MLFTLTVKPNDKLEVWFIFVDGRPVTEWNRDLQTPLRLDAGKHRLTYQLHGKGGELEISLEPNAALTTPVEATWPYNATVPKNRAGTQNAIYFDV